MGEQFVLRKDGAVNLIFSILRAHPLVLGLIAAACFVGGYFLQVHDNELAARQINALRAGMPAAVDIEDFVAERDMNDVRETHIRAQVHMDAIYELTLTRNTGDDIAVMVPLLATDATTPEVIGVAIWDSNDLSFEDVDQARLMAKADSMGPFGPITRFNGFHRGSVGTFDEMVEDALNDEGLALASGAVIVAPFLHGRHIALDREARGGPTPFGIFSKIGGAFALLALFKMAVSGRRDYDEDAIPLPTLAEDTSARDHLMFGAGGGAMSTPVPSAAEADPSVPLWKQRLMARQAAEGLAPAEDAHAHAEPAAEPDWTPEDDFVPKASYGIVDEAAMQPSRRITPEEDEGPIRSSGVSYDDPWAEAAPRRRWGLRKILIGIVGAAFALTLALTLTGLVSEAIANDQTAANAPMSSDEAMGWALAETLYPSTADPDRPFYEIDPAPVVQWFIATGFMAWRGDTTSIIVLSSIVAVLFLSGFMIRYGFFVRSVYRTRRYADFSDMGVDF